jgi:hypothetical protein
MFFFSCRFAPATQVSPFGEVGVACPSGRGARQLNRFHHFPGLSGATSGGRTGGMEIGKLEIGKFEIFGH